MKIRKARNRVAAILVAFIVAFTMMPAAAGGLDANAATSYWKSIKAKATSETSVKLSWKTLTKTQQKKISGIAVYRDGKLKKRISKYAKSFNDTRLKAGSRHTYQLKTYKTRVRTVRYYFNKKTGKWQTKRISGARTKKKKKTIYKYSNASKKVFIQTTKESVALEAPQNVKAVYTGDKGDGKGGVTVSWDKVSGAEYYWVHNSFGEPRDSNENSKSFTLPLGQTYTFQISAVKNWEEGPKSKAVSVTLPASGEDPGDQPTTDPKMVQITDYKGNTITVEEGSAQYNDPRYNRNIDGTFTVKSATYTQKGGVTFQVRHELRDVIYTVYNGDASKMTLEHSKEEFPYKAWGRDQALLAPDTWQDRKHPRCEDCIYILGDRGRRLADVRRTSKSGDNYNRLGLYFDVYDMDTGVVNVIAKYGDETIDTTTINLGEELGDDGLSDAYRWHYNIGKAAVELYENGGECVKYPAYGLSQRRYQQLKERKGKYYADMEAVGAYVYENFEYSDIDCWVGSAILCTFSSVEYGEYGTWVELHEINYGHIGFRPDSYCDNGWFDQLPGDSYQSYYASYFDTNGHH